MTSAQGSAGLAWCLGGHAISCAPGGVRIGALSSMAALSSGACSRLRCRTAWRILRFRLGERALDAVVGFLFAGLWGSACSY